MILSRSVINSLIRNALLLGVFVMASTSVSASDQPLMEVEFETREVVPGQSVPLRLTILVPTWMPEPVEFPDFEMPNLRVRLPGRSTFPTGRRVGSETWSGVVRTYQLTPLAPGLFEIPPQEVEITYAEPGGIEPITVVLQTDPMVLSGVVPEGAESLRPFIAATSLTLEQEVSPKTRDLAPGEGIERIITARIAGSSPFSLPRLMPDHHVPGMRVYPDAPSVVENEDGGSLSGIRIERIMLMAEGDGAGEAPEVAVRWYNLESGTIETSRVPGFDVTVIAPPPPPAPPDYGRIARNALFALVAAAALFWLLRRIWPSVDALLQARRQRYLDSERYAFGRLRESIQSRNYTQALAGLEAWAALLPGTDPSRDNKVSAALDAIGRAHYSPSPTPEGRKVWGELYAALCEIRQTSKKRSSQLTGALPQLNP